MDIEEKLDEYRRAATLDAAADIIFQLKQEPPAGIGLVLDEARAEAEGAMLALVTVDPDEPKLIRELQWRVTRFQDLVRFVEKILESGKAAKADISDEHALDLIKLLNGADFVPDD